jgi:CRP/FNR family transcriptional regulator
LCIFSTRSRLIKRGESEKIVPAGAILFVEGQAARGIFILCSGKVNLSTTSNDGKILIRKTAGPGEALGLSASVSSTNYETTAETASPCLVNFIERKHFLELMQAHNEMGLHTTQWLSLDYQTRIATFTIWCSLELPPKSSHDCCCPRLPVRT